MNSKQLHMLQLHALSLQKIKQEPSEWSALPNGSFHEALVISAWWPNNPIWYILSSQRQGNLWFLWCWKLLKYETRKRSRRIPYSKQKVYMNRFMIRSIFHVNHSKHMVLLSSNISTSHGSPTDFLAKEPRQVFIGVRQVPGKPHVPRIRDFIDQLPEPHGQPCQDRAIPRVTVLLLQSSFWVILGLDASCCSTLQMHTQRQRVISEGEIFTNLTLQNEQKRASQWQRKKSLGNLHEICHQNKVKHDENSVQVEKGVASQLVFCVLFNS